MDFSKMNERVIFVRESSKLNQEDFARRLGLTKSAISGYETGRRVPTEAVLKSIAREFKINEDWLKTGQGAPETTESSDVLGQLFEQYSCSGTEKTFLRTYFQFDEKERQMFCAYMKQMFGEKASMLDSEVVIDKTISFSLPPTLGAELAELRQSVAELKRQNAALQQQVDEIQAEDTAAEEDRPATTECLARQSTGEGSP